ncbi:MAG TPA: F420-0--gamma-glutamyl ligase [Firmicutes bacterium]|jgi:F420-0:gamma-glutamyl ligase|nr:F420-0--gamma-glutamyl ligase [Bacillota bacterium]
MRTVGTQVRGIRAPIIKQGDDLVQIVVDSLLQAAKKEGFILNDRDVIGITESLVARAQGNYVTLEVVSKDLKNKFGAEEIGVVFPLISRNRFSLILKAIAQSFLRVYLLLSYPSDEVGNSLMDIDRMEEAGINPYTDFLTEEDYRRIFGEEVKHPFTGVDYVQTYKDLGIDGNISIYFSNNPRDILRFTRNVLTADIHSRERTKRILKESGALKLYGLDDICTEVIAGSGYNRDYGLLGSNVATEEKLKLFPRDGQFYVDEIQKKIKELTGKQVEVLIYGDGAFKDPVAKIWELADPVVSPAFTPGLSGVPNEIKIKYLADHLLDELSGEAVDQGIKEYIKGKNLAEAGDSASMGTTPRRLIDLLGSLCDLTSGSGDKGTPIVLVQGYFDNFSAE